MLTKMALASLLSVLAFTLGCDVTGPPAGLPHAAANLACGPADGAATAINLARDPIPSDGPTIPYVAIMIDKPVSALAGHTWQVGGGEFAQAAYITSAAFEVASRGTVEVGQVDSDSTIHGVVKLWFSSRPIAGTFTATWIHRTLLCG